MSTITGPVKPMQWKTLLVALAVLPSAGAVPQADFKSTLQEKPFPGLVPDRETAIAIGKAVLRPLFGKSPVDGAGPFKATLVESIWTVVGSPPPDYDGAWDPIYVHISRHNAYIVEIGRIPYPSRKSFDLYIKLFGDTDKAHGIKPSSYVWR